MLSKELIAFFLGAFVVIVGITAFVIYDNQHSVEYDTDAEGGTSTDKNIWEESAKGLSVYGGRIKYTAYSMDTTIFVDAGSDIVAMDDGFQITGSTGISYYPYANVRSIFVNIGGN
jgi:hypothetical protein